MATERGKAAARDEVRRSMAGETIQAFAKRARVDPQTLGDFLAGRRWPLLGTLNKIEDALGLTLGTLAALGEEPDPSEGGAIQPRPAGLADLSTEELLAELTYRFQDLKHEIVLLRSGQEMLFDPVSGAPVAADDSPARPTLRAIGPGDQQVEPLPDELARILADAARHGRKGKRAFDAAHRRDGEESQDPGK